MSALLLAEAKRHLNMTRTENDAELQDVIDAAEAVVSTRVGPLTSVATTSRVLGGDYHLKLPVTPVISLTSVTPVSGTQTTLAALTVSDLDVTAAGVVEHKDGYNFPERRYDVVYQAGRATVPDDLLLAIKELVRWMWDTQRAGSSARPASGYMEQASDTLPGAMHLLPLRVEQILSRHQRYW